MRIASIFVIKFSPLYLMILFITLLSHTLQLAHTGGWGLWLFVGGVGEIFDLVFRGRITLC